LAQVNILVGRNNSGKSTILDALILLRSAIIGQDYLEENGIHQILSRRVDRGRGNFNYDELWYGMRTDEPVLLKAALNANVKISETWTSRGTGNSPGSGNALVVDGSAEFNWASDDSPYTAKKFQEGNIWRGIAARINEDDATFLALIHILDPNGAHIPYAERIWPELINDRRDIKVTRMLNEIYGTNIEYLSFMPHPNQVRLVAAVPHTGLAVDWMGDGFRYAVNILALGVVLQGTALLVEELETHQHPESLRKLTETLFELAKQQDLQLFLTTHSMELISYALEAAQEKEVDLMLHHLNLNEKGTLHSTPFTKPNAQMMLDIGHDPRLHYKYTGVA
jgi:energy-coupling factor transporter ATP-binding protein EcfA2